MRVTLKFKFLLSVVSIAFLLCVSSVASSEQLVTTSLSVSSGPWVEQREVLGHSANSSYSLSISDQKYRYKYNFEVCPVITGLNESYQSLYSTSYR